MLNPTGGGFLGRSSSGSGLDLTSGGTIGGNLVVSGTLNVTGATDLDSTLNVDGAMTAQVGATLNNTSGTTTIKGATNIQGAADLDSTLNVDGATTHVGALTQTGAANINGRMVLKATSQSITAVTDTIAPTTPRILLTADANRTLTSTPTITTAGVADGTYVILENVGATFDVVLQDEAALAGSAVENHTGAARTIGPGDIAAYVFNATAVKWKQCTFLIAI